jgi:catechol 2,3-dioxygenase-like lactoylglutathione lyase family enzyme
MKTAIRHHHTALHVTDMERSARFYVEGLGLTRVRAWTSGRTLANFTAVPTSRLKP